MFASQRYFELKIDEDAFHWSAVDWIYADVWPGDPLPDVSSMWDRAQEAPERARELFGAAARFGDEDRAIALWQDSEAYKADLCSQKADIIRALDALLDLARPVRTTDEVAQMTRGLRRNERMIACYREDLILYQAALAVGHLHWTGTATNHLSLITTPEEVWGIMNTGALTQEMVDELQNVLAAYRDPIVGIAQIEGQLGSLGLWEPFGVRYDPLFFILESGIMEYLLDDLYRRQTGGRPQDPPDDFFGPNADPRPFI